MIEKLIAAALELGFSYCAPLDAATLKVMPEVRDMCKANRCGKFDKSWSCPPGCGGLDRLEAKMKAYKGGFLVQTVGEMEDDFDYDSIVDAERRHKENLEKLTPIVLKQYPNAMPMGSGGCDICESCTYPDQPCRFPEKVFPSMEACGLMVNQICVDNGLKYNYGKRTISFTACYLTD